MYGTLFSIAIALFVIFNPFEADVIPGENLMGMALIIVATIFVVLLNCSLAMSWWPLQKAERDFTPRILQLFKKDKHLSFVNFWLLFFPLISYAVAVDLMFLHLFAKKYLLAFWIILLGIAVDALYHFLRRVLDYLNPFSVVEMFSKQATHSVQQDHTLELCQWLDALSEIAIKATTRSSISLANHSLNALPGIVETYLKAAKSIGHMEQSEKVSYTLFYLFQRLELVNQKAVERSLELVCSHLINTMGKIAVHAAEFDLSILQHPLQYIGRFADHAQSENMTEVADHATCTLIEVANTILTQIDVTYLELKEPFLTLISELEEITKEEFRQDKSINIKILKHPFEELKVLFAEGKIAEHQDAKVIMQDIDRVLAEYSELDMIMRTVPPIPIEEEKEE